MNREYDPAFLKIEDWEDRFFLNPYYRKGKPILLFNTPLVDRLKITAPYSSNRGNGYYEEEEYLELLEDFLDKSEKVIEYRTDKIIETLRGKLML